MNEPNWMLDEARRFDQERRRARLRQLNWGLLAGIAFSLIVWALAGSAVLP